MKHLFFLLVAVVAVLFLGATGSSRAQTDAAETLCRAVSGRYFTSHSITTRSTEGFCDLPSPDGRLRRCQAWDLYYSRCPERPGIKPITDIRDRTLHDGDLIRRSGDPDIYIIKFVPSPTGQLVGYKRLFLNPVIFSFYGHLGGYENVRTVRDDIFQLFETSGLFRNCETRDERVWATEVTGEDTATLHHVQISGDQALNEDVRFFQKVFCINSNEERWYAKSIFPYTRLADVPRYQRRFDRLSPSVQVTNPRGGETFVGSAFEVSWDADLIDQSHEFFVSLFSEEGIGGTLSVVRVPFNERFTFFPVPRVGEVNAEGRYRIRIAVHRDSPSSGPAGPVVASDESRSFTIANQACVALPACALPDANPQCAIDLAPGAYACRLPLEHFLNVSVTNTSTDLIISLNGSHESACGRLLPVSIDVQGSDIRIVQQEDPGESVFACGQGLVPFTRNVSVGDLLTPDTAYNVFVNGVHRWTGTYGQ